MFQQLGEVYCGPYRDDEDDAAESIPAKVKKAAKKVVKKVKSVLKSKAKA